MDIVLSLGMGDGMDEDTVGIVEHRRFYRLYYTNQPSLEIIIAIYRYTPWLVLSLGMGVGWTKT